MVNYTFESLYAIMSSIADGIISVDRERNIVFINKAAQKYTGWNEQDAIGQRLDTVFNVIDSKTREKVECHFAKLVNSSGKTSFSYCPILVSKSGSERYISVNVSPVKYEDGQVSGAVVSFRDVTCHRQVEEELKIERRNLKTQFQYSPVAMVIVDENAVVQDVNDHYIDMFGNLNDHNIVGEKLGKSLGCVCTLDNACGESEDCGRCPIKKYVLKVIKSKIPFRDAENRYQLLKNGKRVVRDLKFNLVPVKISGKTNVLISIDDMTEYRVMEESMCRAMEATKAAYRAKSEFLANMSHEIRTPLNGIIGMLDLTMRTELTNDQLDNLSTAKTCANSLLKIINDVLDFSKLEAGKMTIEHVEFDFKALMEKIVKVHYYRAIEKGIELTYQLPGDLPGFLIGDPNRLQQVLNNLLSNAVKFTDKGCVSLAVKIINCIDDFVRLQFSVKDTGIGISSSEMSKLFKSFSQIDGSQTRRHGGTGLGLVISRQLVEMMGGDLKVESEKGKGSTFSFDVKFEVGGRDKGIVDRVEQLGVGKSKTDARILLVEDDKVNQTVISRMLKEMGYKCDIANCGRDALKLLENNSYGLCLMDIQMPGLDGIQTASLIRQNEHNMGKRHMPIVAITAHALQGDREKFLSLGMDEYIAKPFQMSELFILIEKLLAGQAGENSRPYNELSLSKPVDMMELNNYIKRYTREIKPIIKEISSNIEKLKLVIKDENIQRTEEVAHNIKILASSISADKIKNHAFRIELAARRGNQPEADKLCRELEEIFEKYSNITEKTEDSV